MLSKFRCKDNAIFADAQIFLRNFCNFAAVNEDNAALRRRFFFKRKLPGIEIDGNLIKIDGN